MLTLFGFKQIGMSGGGTLAVLMMGTTIHNSIPAEELEEMEKPVGSILSTAWSKVGAVLLFTLLGASLDASKLSPWWVMVCCWWCWAWWAEALRSSSLSS